MKEFANQDSKGVVTGKAAAIEAAPTTRTNGDLILRLIGFVGVAIV